jgi:hypothetical protein
MVKGNHLRDQKKVLKEKIMIILNIKFLLGIKESSTEQKKITIKEKNNGK